MHRIIDKLQPHIIDAEWEPAFERRIYPPPPPGGYPQRMQRDDFNPPSPLRALFGIAVVAAIAFGLGYCSGMRDTDPGRYPSIPQHKTWK